MRGTKQSQVSVACLINVETMIPEDHPIRAIKRLLEQVLAEMDGHFEEMYAENGRPSIPPERLLLAKVLMALYSIRSERQFCERLQYDLLFRWFLDLNPDEPAFDHSTFSQNQARLLQHKVADLFFAEVVWLAQRNGWISDQHFSVDATLIEAWASLKSFKPKGTDQGPGGGNGWTDFKGEARHNDTHASTTDPEAKLARKGDGREARLAFTGHELHHQHVEHGDGSRQPGDAQGEALDASGFLSAHGRRFAHGDGHGGRAFRLRRFRLRRRVPGWRLQHCNPAHRHRQLPPEWDGRWHRHAHVGAGHLHIHQYARKGLTRSRSSTWATRTTPLPPGTLTVTVPTPTRSNGGGGYGGSGGGFGGILQEIFQEIFANW